MLLKEYARVVSQIIRACENFEKILNFSVYFVVFMFRYIHFYYFVNEVDIFSRANEINFALQVFE